MKNLKKLGLVAGLATLISFGAEAQTTLNSKNYLFITSDATSSSEGGQLILNDNGNSAINSQNNAWNMDVFKTSMRIFRNTYNTDNFINFMNKIRISSTGQFLISSENVNFDMNAAITTPESEYTLNNKGKTWFEDLVQVGAFTTNIPTTVKLAVNGGIYATSVKVILPNDNAWPDYVFKKDYKLRPLAEVEQFIAANNHLPDVPSEVAVKENGIDVANMDAVLLRKVEELTLYMIQLQKDNLELKAKLEALSK